MRRTGRRAFVDAGSGVGRVLAAIWVCRRFIFKHKRFPTTIADLREHRVDAIVQKLASGKYRDNPLEAGSFLLWNMRYALEEDKDPTLAELIQNTFTFDDLIDDGLRSLRGDTSIWVRRHSGVRGQDPLDL